MAVATVILLGAVLAARPAAAAEADPARQAARLATLGSVAAEADLAWSELQQRLESARDAAREGAALIIEGSDPPGPPLSAAAEELDAAVAVADAAGAGWMRCTGTAAALGAEGPSGGPPAPPAVSELAGIADQLRAAAEAAVPFIARRHAAEETLASLADAVAALDAGRLEVALPALAAAAEARQVLVDWQEPPVTLQLWLETTGTMIDAARAIAVAAAAGDEDGLQAAAAAYAAAAKDARRADVSLALSLSETGAALTNVPLRRVADGLAATLEARAWAAGVADAGG